MILTQEQETELSLLRKRFPYIDYTVNDLEVISTLRLTGEEIDRFPITKLNKPGPKFKAGDKIRIINNIHWDYGNFLNKEGTIFLVGIKREVRSYLAKFGKDEIRVFEPDIELI